MKRIITIGRELGSGGRTIGKLVANRLGIAYYDYELIDESIKDIARKESCVIVGRCADYILADRDDVLKVFIYADKDSRVEHGIKEYGMAKDSALKEIEKSDKERSRHYNTYTDKVWGDRHNYDLMLDSSQIDYENCVKIICNLAKEL